MPLISQKKCSWLVISDRTSSLHKEMAKEAPTLRGLKVQTNS